MAMPTNQLPFSCFNKRGFQLKFPNGWTASVMWGKFNYADNQRYSKGPECQAAETAEVACWPENGDLTDIWDHGDAVKGHLTVTEVLEFLNTVAAFPR